MHRFRLGLAIVASFAIAQAAFAQTQPIPGAINANGNPANVTGVSPVIAPAGGGAGRGRVVAEDSGFPIQGRDTVSGLPCAIGPTATCQLPGSGGGGGGASATATAAAPTYTEGATVNLSTDLSGYLRSLAKQFGTWVVNLGTTDAANLATVAANSGSPLPAGTNTIGTIFPIATTPVVGNATTVTVGGTAVNMVTGPVKGCYITNPTSATDQGIGAAENAYVNPVTTATTTGNGSNVTLAPGQSWFCIPGQTTNVSVNAATSAHALTVVKW